MRVALAIASVSLLAALPAAAELQPNCNEKCEVVITMSAGCGSGIKVAPDPVVVGAGRNPEITWTVKAEAWAFDAGGIVFHQPGEAFEKGPASGKQIRMKNKNRRPGTYKYDVVLKGPGGQCRLDPVIINH
jgi:hypothetical protein